MKYNIFAGIKGEETHFEKGLEFATFAQALSYAEYWAYDLYYLNPKLDILEIMKEVGVNEDVAEILFINQMVNSVEFSAEEADKE
jgi:hypothetical protein